MKPVLLPLVMLLGVAAIAQGPKMGKLVGRIDLWPVTPVERPGHDPKVPPAMYKQYTVQITKDSAASGSKGRHIQFAVIQLTPSDAGRFSADLAPGDYQVSVKAKHRMMNPPEPQIVRVVPGKTTQIKFRIDTGIR